MANRGNHNADKTPQPGWEDVATTLAALEHTYGRHVEICIDREGARGASGAMWVYAKAYRRWTTTEAPLDVTRALWPQSFCKTMPALMFRLLHQLDHAMDARNKEEQSESDLKW